MAINRKSKSILEEINSYIPNKNREDLIDSRAQHIITSAINLMTTIEETFSEEEADLLKKRFMSSIRGNDPKRFTRMVNRIKNGTDSEDDSDI